MNLLYYKRMNMLPTGIVRQRRRILKKMCIRDRSRLGRDYLKVGQVMEILRQRGVRLIAINDGVDSLKGDDRCV